MNTTDNPYLEAMEAIGEKVKAALADGRVTKQEAAGIVVAIIRQADAVIHEAHPFDREDVKQLTEAAQEAYDRYVVPLDLPGGAMIERLEDMVLRNYVIPWLIEGIYEAVNGNRLSGALSG